MIIANVGIHLLSFAKKAPIQVEARIAIRGKKKSNSSLGSDKSKAAEFGICRVAQFNVVSPI